MAYKVFTNGSTLQASEVNENLMRQVVATFTNTAARTAAITAPVEGQMTYLEDSNLYQHWNGSSWVSPFGLTHLVSQTIGTSVSSVVVSNVFSSAYDNYLIHIYGSTSTIGGSVNLNLNNSTGSTYQWAGSFFVWSGTQTSAGSGGSAITTALVGLGQGQSSTSCLIQIRNPFATLRTTWNSQVAGDNYVGAYGGYDNNAVSHTGFSISASGNLTGGTIAVYGYRRA